MLHAQGVVPVVVLRAAQWADPAWDGSGPGPSLEQHLVSRRTVLRTLGAAAAGVALGVRCGVPNGTTSWPEYLTVRVPAEGELSVVLASGETIAVVVSFYLDRQVGPVFQACGDACAPSSDPLYTGHIVSVTP